MDMLRQQYEQLGADADEEQRKITAQALERRQYSPMLILDVPEFFYLTKADMLSEFDRVMKLPATSKELKAVVGIADPDQIKEKHLTTLLHHYELLCGLRNNDAEAWATVNELYEDD